MSDDRTNLKKLPSNILEGLYVGCIQHSNDLALLQKLNIKKIVIVGTFIDALFPNDFEYKIIEVNDLPNSNIEMYFNETYK